MQSWNKIREIIFTGIFFTNNTPEIIPSQICFIELKLVPLCHWYVPTDFSELKNMWQVSVLSTGYVMLSQYNLREL